MQKILGTTERYRRPKLDAEGGLDTSDLDRDWLIYRLLNMGAYSDRDGRPLSESKVPLEQRRLGVPFELRPCPYPGSRGTAQPARPMNISAMKRVQSTLPEALGTILHLRTIFFARYSRKTFTFRDLWRLGMIISAVPRFLAWRKVDYVVDGQLPPSIADAQKIAAGINSLMLELAVREIVSDQTQYPSIEFLIKEADRMLIGEEQVCAAPQALIVEALKAFAEGAVSIKTSNAQIKNLITDAEAFFAFALSYADLKTFLWLLIMLHELVLHDASATLSLYQKEAASNADETATRRLPTLERIRQAMLSASSVTRFRIFQKLAKNLVSQDEPLRTRLLGVFRHAITILISSTAQEEFTHLREIRERFPLITDSGALQIGTALSRCCHVESAIQELLIFIESNLRTSLGYEPIARKISPGLHELLIGSSVTARGLNAFGID